MKKLILFLSFFVLTAATEYKPLRNEDFNANSLAFNGKGITGTAAHGTATNIDTAVTEDTVLTGGNLVLKDQCFGDTVDQQVVDKDGIVAPPGTVLRQFITSWNVADDVQIQGGIVAPGYPAKIISGLYLRLVYHSTCGTDVKVAINYLLHKVLY